MNVYKFYNNLGWKNRGKISVDADLFEDNSTYTHPPYNFNERIKEAKQILWQWKKSKNVRINNAKILSKHVKTR